MIKVQTGGHVPGIEDLPHNGRASRSDRELGTLKHKREIPTKNAQVVKDTGTWGKKKNGDTDLTLRGFYSGLARRELLSRFSR